MEDVVLHYQSGSAAGLSSLLETTQKLLEPFPCRTPPVFSPWFPAAADRPLPIRPAKPAPVITCSHDGRPDAAETIRAPEDGVCVSETLNRLLPAALSKQPGGEIRSPEKHKDGFPVAASPVKRSWSVFTQRGVVLHSSRSLSKQFHHMVSVHRLHLRQRAKWVINQSNCGGGRDIEQVWRALSRSVRGSSGLPTCNANIQRERAEIWVFCDVIHSEQVGRFLKDELQLSGRIALSVHRLGNVFSL